MSFVSPLSPLAGTSFVKMSGTGNDFILIDNRAAGIPAEVMPLLAEAVCCRRRSVGADGLILLEPSARQDSKRGRVDWRWHFYNADGSSAEMCGNGGRCAARFAYDIGLAGETMLFDTIAGPIGAEVKGDQVKLEMTRPHGAYADLELSLDSGSILVSGVNTGVPHAVVLVQDLENAPVVETGKRIRYHSQFAPAGSNVNFAQIKDGDLLVRTYERGVEDETLACGTGALASALIVGGQASLKPPVRVRVRSGETLLAHFSLDGGGYGQVFLEGGAAYIYDGVLRDGAFAWQEFAKV